MNQTVYVSVKQISEVHKKDVFLSDIADVFCSDTSVESRCKAIKVKTIHSDENRRYMGTILDIVQKIAEIDSSIQVNSVGETDFIIDFQNQKNPRYALEWFKTILVCMLSFFGAAFAIMTFNNDVNVTDVFKKIYFLVMGTESSGFTVLEVSYSIGLAVGIVVFFNHFAKRKLNTDPTPLEVEMRLYEENINKTLIQNDERKESGVDVR